ncbi:DUF4349 domain-containing protein [Siminovitchia sp. 179-K 8D1 HS]|uniref:DUF4349 domain-containing protein n=1 Tax=Siminovitchia sp. 179-K 8D1 HS TaxID=3142385 RepID=UPI00399F3673
MAIKKFFSLLLCIITAFALAACSSDDSPDSSGEMAKSSDSSASNEIAMRNETENSTVDEPKEAEKEAIIDTDDRMIIHRADLEVKVKSLEKARQDIEKKVKEYGGYIVESNIYREENELMSGHLTIRIPEKHFQQFLNDAEEAAAEIMGRTVTGQDVTEEYVDLESRLKSKRAVERRLLDFMKDAQKTEDLLKISRDLAKVQEDIEVIVGKMKYLENQTAYSTVDISMQENRVVVPGVDGDQLNTWEKTKKQLAVSVNFLLAAASSLVVFFVGNLPVIILVAVIGLGVYYFVKRRKRKKE